MGGFVHMIDAMNGKELWAEHMGLFPASISTGTPVLVGDKVIAPSSQYEIMLAAQESHECCKIHGGVVALDAMTGKRVWEGHTMENAKPLRDRGDGKMIWGPSGAPVWNSPSIDLKRNALYVGTGEANSAPAHKNTNAIIAFDMKDGSIKWSHQATADDVYNATRAAVGSTARSRTRQSTATSTSVLPRFSRRRRTARTWYWPGRSPARSGRWIPIPARLSGAAISARAARWAASIGASLRMTPMSMLRSPTPAAQFPDRKCPKASSRASMP
jgi:glucose dehydrogenase